VRHSRGTSGAPVGAGPGDSYLNFAALTQCLGACEPVRVARGNNERRPGALDKSPHANAWLATYGKQRLR
jgi:hypothetical protein